MSTGSNRWMRRGLGVKLALVGAGIAAGAVLATAVGANAVTSGSGSSAPSGTTPPTAQPTSQPSGAPPMRPGPFGHGGPAPVRTDEHTLGSALAAKLKAAALKAVPGGTVYRIESDSGDGTYEAHMTKADGSLVTVKFDRAGKVAGVEQGMGK
jgi:hypothetical protein